MAKYNTRELVDQLLIRGTILGPAPAGGNYAYATGYLSSFIEMLPSTVKLTAKQDKAFREAIQDCITRLVIENTKNGAAQ